MGKIETQKKYARVMHHIGGVSGKNDNSAMILGGVDELNLVDDMQLRDLESQGVDIARLIKLGALREATEDEAAKFEINAGIREAAPTSELFAQFTTGNEGLNVDIDPTKTGTVGSSLSSSKEAGSAEGTSAPGGGNPDLKPADLGATGSTGGSPSGGSQNYKGMTKGELSEHTVPELQIMAKEAGIAEKTKDMKKDDILSELLSLGQ